MDRIHAACCTGGMWRAMIIGAALMMAGCAYFRAEDRPEPMPNATAYPAPAVQGRYMPWIQGLSADYYRTRPN
ncbi:hypothetical protein [Roseococcus sp. YIM B11640]|uniref:hypothetical protein n=1 Tax=Roseococcus sp. YIM B11640 TaxID=3133973 RepID=UPI003C7B72B6